MKLPFFPMIIMAVSCLEPSEIYSLTYVWVRGYRDEGRRNKPFHVLVVLYSLLGTKDWWNEGISVPDGQICLKMRKNIRWIKMICKISNACMWPWGATLTYTVKWIPINIRVHRKAMNFLRKLSDNNNCWFYNEVAEKKQAGRSLELLRSSSSRQASIVQNLIRRRCELNMVNNAGYAVSWGCVGLRSHSL
jgi:hypothetical protein